MPMMNKNMNKNSCFFTLKGTKILRNLPISITVGDAEILFKHTTWNLDLTLHWHLTITEDISTIARACYHKHHHLATLHKFFINAATATHACTYQIACMCYHCYSSTALSYVNDLGKIKPSHTHNTHSSAHTRLYSSESHTVRQN